MTKLAGSVFLATVLLTLGPTDANAQNVKQVNIAPGHECSDFGVVSDIPGLTLSLETAGGPVLVMYTVQFNGNSNAQISLWPVIDGVTTDTSSQRDRHVGVTAQIADVTF